jgi:hypothetical protein
MKGKTLLTKFYYKLISREEAAWGNLGMFVSICLLAPSTFIVCMLLLLSYGVPSGGAVLFSGSIALIFFMCSPLIAMTFEWLVSKSERKMKKHRDRVRSLKILEERIESSLDKYSREMNYYTKKEPEDYAYAYIPKGFVGFYGTPEVPGFKLVTK